MESITVSGLRKSYGPVRAVDGVDFAVESGEIFGMLGPNGAGKTTTVEILVGLRERDAGEVLVLGKDPGREPQAVKSRIGVQLQVRGMYPRLTVLETLKLFSSFYPRKISLPEILERVGLADKARVQTKALSGGQLQRLAVGLAMVSGGDILFLDEPTTGLDPQARHTLWDAILDLKRQGKTVFLTTHFMDEAEHLCDRVLVIDHGRVLACGSPSELIDENFREQAIEFTNSPATDGDEFQHLPGVNRVQVEGDQVTLYSTDVAGTIAALMAYATRKKEATGQSPIDHVVVRRATLEDVFLKLTGRRIRE
ncbi:MAG: ABC transporter ATP-binding protein [Clostridia bacterium]|nr:ABC transporter ATP-binding protein [Clostridia bacterium]